MKVLGLRAILFPGWIRKLTGPQSALPQGQEKPTHSEQKTAKPPVSRRSPTSSKPKMAGDMVPFYLTHGFSHPEAMWSADVKQNIPEPHAKFKYSLL